MSFSEKDVEKLTRLSRLYLSDEEKVAYQEQLGSVLNYVSKLQELNTDDIPELQHAAGQVNVSRADEVAETDESVRERAIENFPSKEGDLLEVQAVFTDR